MLYDGNWDIDSPKYLGHDHILPTCQEKSSALRDKKKWPTVKKPWEKMHLDYAGHF